MFADGLASGSMTGKSCSFSTRQWKNIDGERDVCKSQPLSVVEPLVSYLDIATGTDEAGQFPVGPSFGDDLDHFWHRNSSSYLAQLEYSHLTSGNLISQTS